jgi:ABC-type transporter Mla subunit MlaD
MSDEAFRWVILAFVVLCWIGFSIQAAVMVAMYRALREAQQYAKGAENRVGPLIQDAEAILGSTRKILAENSPRIAEISAETAGIVKTAREQVERVKELLDDAQGRIRARIEQIDQQVDNTVEQVAQVGETVKSAALKPVTEVNGIIKGVKAAVTTYAQGGKRPSVDHATQDEEMFI